MFKDVKFLTAVKDVANAKLAPDAAAELVRKSAIVPAAKLAVDNFNTWKAYLDKKREESKKLLETAEQKLKEMQNEDWIPNPFTLGEIKGCIDILKATAEHLRATAEKYAEAFAADGYRGNSLADTVKTHFPQIPAETVAQFVTFVEAARTKIISDNRPLNAVRDRVGEYAKRCEVVYDAAQAAQKKAFGQVADAKERLKKFVKDCEGHEAEVKESLRKVTNKVVALTSTLKLKKDAGTTNTIKGLLGERAENMKKATGGLKTFRLTLEAAEKVYNDAPSKDVMKEYTSPLLKLRESYNKMQKEADEVKDKALPTQDKVILAAGYKLS